MSKLKDLLHEIHRRSVWQVFGVYLAVSWVVIQVVETLTESAGLPDWVPPGSIVLLLIGLPIVLATAIVQEGVGTSERLAPHAPVDADHAEAAGAAPAGEPVAHETDAGPDASPPSNGSTNLSPGTGSLDRPSTRPSATRRLFTWRNAIAGGVLAFVLLGLAVGGYFLMWSTGVGPVGSLVAQGVLDERDPVILADFENLTQDEVLGEVVTEALRVDLDRSEVLSPLSPAAVSRVLERMGRSEASELTAELAREAALREGVKAVVEGEIGSAGSGYVLTSRLVSSRGDVLASFRVTARDGSEVIDAIDELSRDMRERSGESLRSINAGERLSEVTTPSLDALRLYSQAIEHSMQGDQLAAVRLLEEALTLDSEFAMAYRKLAVELGNLGMDADRELEAIQRAYELRSRLTDRERGLAEAYYFTNVAPDRARAAAAYERVLDQYPDDPTALNNLALIRAFSGQPDEAITLLQRAVEGPGASSNAHTNLMNGLWAMWRDEQAGDMLRRIESRYTGDVVAQKKLEWAAIRRLWDQTDELARARIRASAGDEAARMESLRFMATADAARGRLAEARDHSAEALGIALDEGHDDWVWFTSAHGAWYELFVARSTTRATRLIDDALTTNPYEGGYASAWEILGLATLLALAGQPDRAAEIAELAESSEERDRFWEMAWLYWEWAHDMASDAPDEALRSLDRLMDRIGCDFSRCWGHFEKGLTLEGAGRSEEAIASYERHLEGTDMTEAPWDGINTTAALEQLCHLSAEAGDQARVQQHCGALLELWSGADPELQARVDAARERMAGAIPATVGP